MLIVWHSVYCRSPTSCFDGPGIELTLPDFFNHKGDLVLDAAAAVRALTPAHDQQSSVQKQPAAAAGVSTIELRIRRKKHQRAPAPKVRTIIQSSPADPYPDHAFVALPNLESSSTHQLSVFQGWSWHPRASKMLQASSYSSRASSALLLSTAFPLLASKLKRSGRLAISVT